MGLGNILIVLLKSADSGPATFGQDHNFGAAHE
jgi:hypothetical protein